MKSAIVWFRQDLRLTDNPALNAALRDNQHVIPLYCFTNDESGDWPLGEASRWWLHHSLTALASDIESFGSKLVIRNGSSLKTLLELVKKTGSTSVYCNALYEPAHIARDNEVKDALLKFDVEFHCYHGNLLQPPSQVANQSGLPYRVYTPFYRFYLKNGFDTQLAASPRKLPAVATQLKPLSVNSLKLLPPVPWHNEFKNRWQPGEQGALLNLKLFCKQHLVDYPEVRDIPSIDGTSGLSPHLHFGEISPRQVIATLNKTAHSLKTTGITRGRDNVIRQLIWRDFAHHILVHFPHTTDKPFLESFSKFPWKRSDKKFLSAWQQGNTGIPVIDAGMRQLWKTGTMHNRVRMIVASLLSKNANLHWLNGARWFWDTLVDADLANNSMNWQWVAGCGVDAAPYFRIFNPVTQGKKFDPDGYYVEKWVPELAGFPKRYLHEPWNAPDKIQQETGIIVGKDYPKPIIDIAETRKQALSHYNALRQTSK
jgi:deoxyribodipyrimidine photo-lyase